MLSPNFLLAFFVGFATYGACQFFVAHAFAEMVFDNRGRLNWWMLWAIDVASWCVGIAFFVWVRS